jgi:hypothetical protein
VFNPDLFLLISPAILCIATFVVALALDMGARHLFENTVRLLRFSSRRA